MKVHTMRHPPSGKGWECQCGVWLGTTRREARGALGWHRFDVNLARVYHFVPGVRDLDEWEVPVCVVCGCTREGLHIHRDGRPEHFCPTVDDGGAERDEDALP